MIILDGKLKQRLLGAVVLIVLAVVFLPIIFNNQGETSRDIVVDVPQEPKNPLPLNTDLTPVETPELPTIPHTDNTTATANTPPDTTAVETTTVKPDKPDSTATQAEKPTASTPNASGITPSWSVQIITLSSEKSANNFRDKLRKHHYNAYVRADGKYFRVFVGPVIDKNEAFRLQKQLQKQFNEKGIVKEFIPERS